MIAEVYPIRRMPRSFTFFDYVIPSNIELEIGDLVSIPFRSSTLQAIVRGIKSTSTIPNLKPVSEILAKHYFSKDDISRMETIARNIFQHPSALLVASLANIEPKWHNSISFHSPTITGQSLNTEIAQLITGLVPEIKQANNLSVQANHQDILLLLKWCIAQLPHQILLLAPNQSLATHLSHKLDLPCITTKQTKKQKTSLFHGWRNGSIKVLIGNRQVSLWPAKKLSLVIALESNSSEWLIQNRNPRFDVRRSAKLLAKSHRCTYLTLGAMPELVESMENVTFFPKTPYPCQFISKKGECTSTSHYLYDDLLSAIELALQSQKKVLLFYNRKGIATHLECPSCGKVPDCGTCGGRPQIREEDLICSECQTEMWIPQICPSCRSPRLKKKGIGNKTILKELQLLFPSHTSSLYEKGKPFESSDITITTDFYLSEQYDFQPKSFGLIADLTLDFGLYSADFNARENVAYKLQQLRMLASEAKAKLIVQTWMTETLNTLLDIEQFQLSELQERAKYQLPPHAKRILLNKKPISSFSDLELQKLNDNDILEVITPRYE